MKKLLVVLVVAMLAFAGLATMAHADQDVWKDSWLSSFPAIWMGQKQDPNTTVAPYWGGYGSNSGADHALAYSSLVLGGTPGTVVSYAYNMSKEAWSGEVVTVNGSATASATVNLTAYSQLKFKVAKPVGGPNVVVEKFFMVDSNAIEHSVGPVTINTTDFSQELTIDLAGTNLIAVAKLWGVIIKQSDNGGGTGTVTFYTDDIRYVGGQKGEVIVKVTGGKRGISIGGSINFGTVQASSYVTGNRSEALTPAQNLIVTNIGDYQTENATLLIENPVGWTNNVTAPLQGANNTYALAAVFNQLAPASNIYTDSLDYLSVFPLIRQATHDGGSGGYFEGDASATYENSGFAIPFNNGTRNLWVKFWPPSVTSTNAEMKIYIVIGF